MSDGRQERVAAVGARSTAAEEPLSTVRVRVPGASIDVRDALLDNRPNAEDERRSIARELRPYDREAGHPEDPRGTSWLGGGGRSGRRPRGREASAEEEPGAHGRSLRWAPGGREGFPALPGWARQSHRRFPTRGTPTSRHGLHRSDSRTRPRESAIREREEVTALAGW